MKTDSIISEHYILIVPGYKSVRERDVEMHCKKMNGQKASIIGDSECDFE